MALNYDEAALLVLHIDPVGEPERARRAREATLVAPNGNLTGDMAVSGNTPD
jgi:hypothetical protein